MKTTKNNCLECLNPIKDNNRKKYCSDRCKYWFNVKKREREKYLPKKKFRNQQYFYMVTRVEYDNRRQGKRCGHMVTGGMSARIPTAAGEYVQLTKANVSQHFKGIPGYKPYGLKLGDGTWIKKDDVKKIKYP